MINEYVRRINYTEDGDHIMRRTIEVDTIAEAKLMTQNLNDQVTRHGSKAHHDIKWICKGGKLIWTHDYVVDATEVAIEASNDHWASMQEERYYCG